MVELVGQGRCTTHDHPNMSMELVIFDSWMLRDRQVPLRLIIKTLPCKGGLLGVARGLSDVNTRNLKYTSIILTIGVRYGSV